ncbi:type IV toxin-antitoxin system AbiEi family antitoxin domain-containing protein [Pseudomonas helvetica]|uniref:type IV toxin-antitoxin system AbiEi family antitoxin n=1 Tax=Pseudomonas helvetica TaxID=3136738 RepID=UPI003265E9CB
MKPSVESCGMQSYTTSMQPMGRLIRKLSSLASEERYLFTPDDLRVLVPDISEGAYKTLLSRAVSQGHLARVCRGLYLFEAAKPVSGLVLFHAAARLRATQFNYISLETALSDCGVISQIPINWISLMSSGRSSIISCGRWGTIEFVHTRQQPQDLVGQIHYDARCRLWRATPQQALRDMKVAKRNMDLIDWSAANEFV